MRRYLMYIKYQWGHKRCLNLETNWSALDPMDYYTQRIAFAIFDVETHYTGSEPGIRNGTLTTLGFDDTFFSGLKVI